MPVKDFKKQKTGNENDDAGPKFSFNPAKAFRGSDALIPLEVQCHNDTHDSLICRSRCPLSENMTPCGQMTMRRW